MLILNRKVSKIGYAASWVKNVVFRITFRIVGEKKFKRKQYYGKKIKEIDETNNLIIEMIESGKPFIVSRFGSTELRTVVNGIERKLGFRKNYSAKISDAICSCSGFFPVSTEKLDEFTELFLSASEDVDVFAVWFNLMEDYVIHTFAPESKLVELEAIEPYRSDNPWSQALEGKKVLVVHPFTESIEYQKKFFDKLFDDKRVLPSFELITYKSVQSLGGNKNYSSWFDALDAMVDDIKQIDFDIAIVGCGAYGMPLASQIKQMGKQVIHLAGATQILFGIRGSRWDSRPEMQKYFNEYWIRPSESEKPQNAERVEKACYW